MSKMMTTNKPPNWRYENRLALCSEFMAMFNRHWRRNWLKLFEISWRWIHSTGNRRIHWITTVEISLSSSSESIAALIHSGQRADHPVYLSDLGAALTSAEGAEQQAVMEEMNVCRPRDGKILFRTVARRSRIVWCWRSACWRRN